MRVGREATSSSLPFCESWGKTFRSTFRKWRVNPQDSRTRNCGSNFWTVLRPCMPEIRFNRSWALLAPSSYLGSSIRSEEHTSELQSRFDLVCRLLLEKKKEFSFALLYTVES